jgi:hypothetical protein
MSNVLTIKKELPQEVLKKIIGGAGGGLNGAEPPNEHQTLDSTQT